MNMDREAFKNVLRSDYLDVILGLGGVLEYPGIK